MRGRVILAALLIGACATATLSAQFTVNGVFSGTFTPTPPETVTGSATGIGQTAATLQGTGDPNGNTTTGRFDWGLTTAYGSVTPDQDLGAGLSPVAIGGGSLTGLTCATTYHFRTVVSSIGGTIFGGDASFETSACPIPPAAPTITTGTADTISTTGAILRGTGNPNGSPTTAAFNWGMTTGYGSTTPSQALGTGSSPVVIDGGGLSTLTCGMTYHFRATGTNAGGTTNGTDATFSTAMCPAPPGRRLLTTTDFSYLGYYNVTIAGASLNGLAYRYVGGDLRFLGLRIGGATLWEFSIAGKNYGDTVTTTTNIWSNIGGDAGQSHNGIWINPDDGKLWSLGTIDYSSVTEPTKLWTRTLNSDGTISNLHGRISLTSISPKRMYGGCQKIAPSFKVSYSVTQSYVCGWGGYTSLMAQSGAASMGLSSYAIPDPANYANNTSIPTNEFKILADHSSGTSGGDWYTHGASGVPTVRDRGSRVTLPKNYYDGGDNRANPTGPTTSTVSTSGTAVTRTGSGVFQTWWVGLTVRIPGSAGTPYTVASVADSSHLVLMSSAGVQTNVGMYTPDTVPTFDPIVSTAYWTSPTPHGDGRWVWGDSYYQTGMWIDGSNRYGMVTIGALCSGKCWYANSTLNSQNRVAELHIFDPAQFGEVLAGTRAVWDVQPTNMGQLTLPGLGAGGTGNGAAGNITGATYNPTLQRAYLLSCGPPLAPGPICRLYVYQVNDAP